MTTYHEDMYDLRDLADPDLDNDEFIAIHRLFDQLVDMPADPMGPVSDELREDMRDAAMAYAEDEPTLIAARHFVEYAQELAEDCGLIPDDLGWLVSCIDWEQAARELRMDYTTVDFHGSTYWVRAV